MRQIAVIGLGNFGSNLARELAEEGAQVIAVDRDKEKVEALKDTATYAVTLNATDEDALKATSIDEVDVAVVCIGMDIEANLLTTLLLKQLGVKQIWSRAISPLQQEILKALKVDSIINLEQEMGRMVARSLLVENVVKHIYLSPGYSVAEVKVPERLVGKTLRDSKLRRDFNVNVVAVRRHITKTDKKGNETLEEHTENVPRPDATLGTDDILVIVGNDQDISKLAKR